MERVCTIAQVSVRVSVGLVLPVLLERSRCKGGDTTEHPTCPEHYKAYAGCFTKPAKLATCSVCYVACAYAELARVQQLNMAFTRLSDVGLARLAQHAPGLKKVWICGSKHDKWMYSRNSMI